MKLNLNLIKEFNNSIKTDVKLSNYSWFNLGGPAEYLFKPDNKKQLIDFLKENKKNKLKITILGAGSNTLIRDNGVKGVVIKLGKGFSKINLVKDCIIEVGAAALDRKISNFAAENNIGNLEFLACIPGTIGGAVIMNSGCYNNDISKVLISITVINLNNLEEREIKREDIKFFYRGNNLDSKLIIIKVTFQGKEGNKSQIQNLQDSFLKEKKESQAKLKCD